VVANSTSGVQQVSGRRSGADNQGARLQLAAGLVA
jgi:hypothetical protein